MTKPDRHPDYWVAAGPVVGTDWCYIPGTAPNYEAPGRVVLCHEGTRDIHPDAERAAASAWELLKRWTAQRRSYPVI